MTSTSQKVVSWRPRLFTWMALALLLGAGSLRAQEIGLERLVDGLELPLAVESPDDGSGRLFVVEQPGRIRVVHNGRLAAEPFLDLSDRLSCCRERGLLGLAFHPDYAANGFFFVNYTAPAGDTVVSRFAVSNDPNRADPDSETQVLTFGQPFVNHNGGDLAFGPDGYLYIASGDGGSGGDPQDNGQSLATLLGKILRLDVDALPVAIPPDNPFVGDAAARDEIWAFGLRNPWRMSFDRETGDLFLGDVGQNDREEIDFQPAASSGGENYGWRLMEGTACFNPSSGCNDGSLTLPILEYGHDEGCSVTGGYRYRGAAVPALVGTYLYGDFCSGRIWGATPAGDGSWSRRVLLDSGRSISSFGEDQDGELYVVHYSQRAGAVYRINGGALFVGGFESGDFAGWKRRRPSRLSIVEPGLAGTAFALAVTVDGVGGPSFLRATQPRRERRLAVDFQLDPNEVDLADDEVEILALVGRGERHVRLTLVQSGGKYRVSLYAVDDGGRSRRVGGVRISPRRATRLGVEWAGASSTEASDGELRLLKKRRVRVEATNLANAGRVVDELQVGLPAGLDVPGAGRFLLDEFVLTR